MMMFAASTALMRRIVIGRGMIVGVAAASIAARMTAAGIPRMTTPGIAGMVIGGRRPHSTGRPCRRRRRVPALGIEARPADGIHRRRSRSPAIGGRELVPVHAGGMVMVELL